jgi:hypothetical protein
MKFDQENKSFNLSLFCLFGIIGLLILFYPRLFLGLDGPLVSDHYEQHFPWAYFLAKSLKSGVLPLWMPNIQSGFPIAAESQIGIFYLPNILLSLLLPIRFAYSYTLIFHFFISGAFTFLFLRKSNINHYGSFIGACVFLFGTSYGGAYYNITSLKTICWLPVLLYALEGYLINKRIRYLFLVALAVGQSLVAGYLQVAALMLFFFSIYSCFRCLSCIRINDLKFPPIIKLLFPILVSGVVGIILALPQILLTLPLALISNRAEPAEAYAYIGSMSPFAFSTLIFPHFQGLFRGNSLYGGILLFYFLLIAFSDRKENRLKIFYRRWVWLTIIATLFALGQWSPVYIAFIKITHFYSFRTPAKFLIFINFSIAMLSAIGGHSLYQWVKEGNQERLSLASRRFYLFLLMAFSGSIIAFMVIFYFGDAFKSLGYWMMEKMFYGKAGRPHELSEYYAKVDSFLFFMQTVLKPSNPYFMVTLLFSFIAIGVTSLSKQLRKAFLVVLIGMLLLDLYVFSFKDIKTDFASYDQTLTLTTMQKKLIQLKKSHQLGRIYGYRSADESLDMIPSINVLYGIEDIGGYSPLIIKRYHETLGLLGNVNDSNIAFSPSQEYVLNRLPLLISMGVTHILSARPLESDKLNLILSDDVRKQWLYEIKSSTLSSTFLVSRVATRDSWEELKATFMAENFNPKETLLLLENEGVKGIHEKPEEIGKVRGDISPIDPDSSNPGSYLVKLDKPAFFVRMISNYKGWKVLVDGKPADILDAYGQFQAVYLPQAGEYKIEFSYTLKDALWS